MWLTVRQCRLLSLLYFIVSKNKIKSFSVHTVSIIICIIQILHTMSSRLQQYPTLINDFRTI